MSSITEPLSAPEYIPETAAEVIDLMAHYPETNDVARARWRRMLSAKLCATLCDNALNAELATVPSLDLKASFTKFSELPFELRARIWRYAAVQGPRIVEIERVPLSSPLQYRPCHPPPSLALLQTCVESRQEVLRLHDLERSKNERNRVVSSKWLRYDDDIIFLDDLDFIPSQSGYVSRAHLPLPRCFKHIEALAMNLELLTEHSHWVYMISHFFPRLRVLFVLIDDERHECIHQISGMVLRPISQTALEERVRRTLAKTSTGSPGPFRELVVNAGYGAALEQHIQGRFWNINPQGYPMVVALDYSFAW